MSRYSHVAALGLLLVSCQKESVSQKNEARALVQGGIEADKQPGVAPCAATNVKGMFTPVGESGGNTLALLRFHREIGKQTLAIAADEDEQAVHVVDVETRTPLGTTKLAGKPARVLVMGDGRIVVSLKDVGALEVLEADAKTGFPLTRRCLVDTPAEPMGLALTADQKTLLVTTRWEPGLSVLDAADMKLRHALELPRDPVSVIASADGKRAFVTHAAGGVMSVVELEGSPDKPGAPVAHTKPVVTSQFLHRPFEMMKPPPKTSIPMKTRRATVKHERIGSQGFVLARADNKIFAPLVTVEPKPPPGSSAGYGSDSSTSPAVVGDNAAIDEKSGELTVKQSVAGMGTKDCFLPPDSASE